MNNIVLAIHGGIAADKKDSNPELVKEVKAGLTQALEAGYAKLRAGGSALDAIEVAIRTMEDNPQFNAGRGAVFTREGTNELDASIMNGADRTAGAVAGVKIFKNPISLARAVMEKSPHVLMTGEGAEIMGRELGLETVDPSYFRTERRWKELQERQKLEEMKAKAGAKGKSAFIAPHVEWGTVGAVARDSKGNLAAGTSTGGMTYKRKGRVGDSPIIGAGTYADNGGAAVSATGHGEFFIRFSVAHEIVSLVKHKKLAVSKAADTVIQGTLKPINAEGGVIVLDPKGNAAFSFNSEGMHRGSITADGKISVAVYE